MVNIRIIIVGYYLFWILAMNWDLNLGFYSAITQWGGLTVTMDGCLSFSGETAV